MSDCGSVELRPNEQVTFRTESDAEYDVARTPWGFYATPSTNARLSGHGLRAVLARNGQRRLYLLLVEPGCESIFETYVVDEEIEVVAWLDTDTAVIELVEAIEGARGG